MTDERQGEALWKALERLPRGGGIIFRHYATPRPERRALFERVRRIARRRRLVLVLAGTARDAAAWRADGVHGRSARRVSRPLIRTAPAHDRRELVEAQREADLVLLSPVFPTHSHPGAPALGATRFAALAGRAKRPVIALGGMTRRRARTLRGIYGWAAIDAWGDEDG
jgi:thiamine-phosphate pyrophosphorylase